MRNLSFAATAVWVSSASGCVESHDWHRGYGAVDVQRSGKAAGICKRRVVGSYRRAGGARISKSGYDRYNQTKTGEPNPALRHRERF